MALEHLLCDQIVWMNMYAKWHKIIYKNCVIKIRKQNSSKTRELKLQKYKSPAKYFQRYWWKTQDLLTFKSRTSYTQWWTINWRNANLWEHQCYKIVSMLSSLRKTAKLACVKIFRSSNPSSIPYVLVIQKILNL